MKIKRKKTQNKQLVFPVISILIIVVIAMYWYFAGNPDEKKTVTAMTNKSTLGQGEVTFISPDSSQKESVLVEIAEDDYSRSNGLMYREELPENQGMLFIFEKEEQQYFWMKNTPTSLDMIFINKNDTIVNIEKYTKPYTTQTYPSRKPAIYVVEVIAGYADQFGIEPGWTIEWKRY